MRSLVHLVNDFSEEYRKEKRNAELLDFSDLEHEAAALLIRPDGTPTELAGEIGARWTEIMVDEYQDVSPVQEKILQALSGEKHNLFMVGDVKQSIYRFRLADPKIFTRKYKSYGPYTEEAAADARILLRENFRSRKEILEAVNQMFSACMSERLGELEYDEDAACGGAQSLRVRCPSRKSMFWTDPKKPKRKKAETERRRRKSRTTFPAKLLLPQRPFGR